MINYRKIDSYSLCHIRVRPQRRRPRLEHLLGGAGKRQRRRARLAAHLVRRAHQNVHAVRAQESDDQCAQHAEQQAGALEGHRHRQDAAAQRALQQVHQRADGAVRFLGGAVLERIVVVIVVGVEAVGLQLLGGLLVGQLGAVRCGRHGGVIWSQIWPDSA